MSATAPPAEFQLAFIQKVQRIMALVHGSP